jgi:hypothetical protein
MREDWPAWAREAWRSMTNETRERARAVITRLVESYDGVLVGPGPLIRELVDDGEMGHRSTMDTIGQLVEADLLEARPAAEGAVLWVPEELMSRPGPAGRDRPRVRFAATRHRNGTSPPRPPA